MTDTKSHPARSAIRLWPGIALLVAQWGVRFGVPILAPETTPFAMVGAFLIGLFILGWWTFLSRFPRRDRFVGAAIFVVAIAGSRMFLHESVKTAGMGILYFVYAMPVLCAAFVAWAAVASKLEAGAARLAILAALAFASCGGWALVRTGGVSIDDGTHFAWRWSPTPEERLLAETETTGGPTEPVAPADSESPADASAPPQWPGFRGPDRNGRVPGTRLATDWTASPPVELWRRPVGPGWSSFAVDGDVFYTQEQRGEEEVVACYRTLTGEPVWMHKDDTRFWEANAGAGPRATPTLDRGRLYAMGAKGRLNALDARTGSVFWSRDVAADTEVDLPPWGFASSPLIVGSSVVVATAGKLAAYDLESGAPKWFGPDGGAGYSSPHLLTVHDDPQVVLMSRAGAVAVEPEGGKVLWSYDWEGRGRIVQPAHLGNGDLLMSRGETTGIRRVSLVAPSDGGEWRLEERWSSRRLKPYFSDLVLHEGHAYGIDGNILAAIDVETGERAWKGGRYGAGQLLLLPDQDLLLVISERGELALVKATPDAHEEIAFVPVLEGKTWNHPVLVADAEGGPILLVRNAEEMAALRLARAPEAGS